MIFRRPPTYDRNKATAAASLCVCLTDAKVPGLSGQGRYKCLLLGSDDEGKPVKIGVHRLVCWLFRGAPEEGKRKRRVAAHDIDCQLKSACVNPLHIRFKTDGDNRKDRARVRTKFKRRVTANLCSSQDNM
jgi:hypothetical protein